MEKYYGSTAARCKSSTFSVQHAKDAAENGRIGKIDTLSKRLHSKINE